MPTSTTAKYVLYFSSPTVVHSIKPSFTASEGTFTWGFVTGKVPFADYTYPTIGELHTLTVGETIELGGVELSDTKGLLICGNDTSIVKYCRESAAELKTAKIAQLDGTILCSIKTFLDSGFCYAFDHIVVEGVAAECDRDEVFENIINRSGANRLYGKNLLVLGDSMTAGHTLGTGKSWAAKIGNRNEMNVTNLAVNGAYMADYQYGDVDNSVYQKVCVDSSALYIADDTLSKADYIAVFAGTNDAATKRTIGESGSADPKTFAGAINLICESLQNRAPTARIMFITPYLRNSDYAQYIEAMEDACAQYSIPVFNNARNGGICWQNESQMAALTLGDALHLNDAGLEYASYKYESFMRLM